MNLSTLFALVLSIGIVVDDAIVVVEGAAHHLERGLSAHDAACAMQELFGPIIGITLVLMAVFVPAAFLPGLTGRMHAQFAIVLAATALLSAINAATLKPTQCALWLRPPVPVAQRNGVVFHAFDRAYRPLERGYLADRPHEYHARLLAVLALVAGGLGVWGIARLPTAFIPTEDQGYLVLGLHLPDGASLQRTEAVLAKATAIARATPGVDQAIAIGGISALDNNATLASAGAVYVILKDWSQRGETASHLYALADGPERLAQDRRHRRSAADPRHRQRQRLQHDGRTRGGSNDFTKLERITRTVWRMSGGLRCSRRSVPACRVEVLVDRSKARRAGRVGRRRVRHAVVLCRFELREPVQQVRPHIPGLCPGGRAVPGA